MSLIDIVNSFKIIAKAFWASHLYTACIILQWQYKQNVRAKWTMVKRYARRQFGVKFLNAQNKPTPHLNKCTCGSYLRELN